MKYSIITINYNNCDGLRRTIESVVNQTCQDFEYIVIDGGSTDGSVEVIKEYADRIDYWVSEPDKGIYNAMNKGILQAHGEYLNFMNSGDCFYDTEVLMKIIEENGDFIAGSYVRKDLNCLIPCENKDVSFYNFCNPSFNHQAMFIKKHIFSKRLYDENLNIVSDWKLIMECLLNDNVQFRYINETIAIYDNAGISSNVELTRKERIKVLYEILPSFVAKDYEILMSISPNIYKQVQQLSLGYRISKLTECILKVLIKIYKLYKNNYL